MNPFESSYSLETIVRYGVAIVVFLSVIIALAYAVWWGFLMVVSGGNESKVKAAVNYIRYALLGVVVLVIVLLVVPLFFNLIGLPYADYFSAKVIFMETIPEIASHIFGANSASYNTDTVVSPISDPGFTDL